jgi:hypothetical protein
MPSGHMESQYTDENDRKNRSKYQLGHYKYAVDNDVDGQASREERAFTVILITES